MDFSRDYCNPNTIFRICKSSRISIWKVNPDRWFTTISQASDSREYVEGDTDRIEAFGLIVHNHAGRNPPHWFDLSQLVLACTFSSVTLDAALEIEMNAIEIEYDRCG